MPKTKQADDSSEIELARHINELELLAAFNTLKSRNLFVRLMLDNVTAVQYIKRAGGSHSESFFRSRSVQ